MKVVLTKGDHDIELEVKFPSIMKKLEKERNEPQESEQERRERLREMDELELEVPKGGLVDSIVILMVGFGGREYVSENWENLMKEMQEKPKQTSDALMPSFPKRHRR